MAGKRTIFGIPIGPTKEAKRLASQARQVEGRIFETIRIGPKPTRPAKSAFLDAARRKEEERRKKQRRSAATIFALGIEPNIKKLTLGA